MGWRERISTAASRRDATCSKLKRIPHGDARFPIPRNVVGRHAGKGVPEEKSAAEIRFLRKTEQRAYAQSNNQKHSLDHSAAKIQKPKGLGELTNKKINFCANSCQNCPFKLGHYNDSAQTNNVLLHPLVFTIY